VVGELRDTRGAAIVIDGGNLTAVLDAGSGAIWWTAPNIQPVGVDDDVVISVQSADYSGDWNGIGLHGSDGTQSWNVGFGSTAVTTQPPTLVVASAGRAVVTNNGNTTLIDTTTGKTVTTLADPDPALLNLGFNDCQFDDRTTLACWETQGQDNPPAAIAGFDSHDGHSLWNVTNHDPNRATVTVTCVYNGVIYGNAQHGPVELDARTGNDLIDNPGLAPTQVTPGWGLVTDLTSQTHPTTAYRATS
jgi:hypothetical protein